MLQNFQAKYQTNRNRSIFFCLLTVFLQSQFVAADTALSSAIEKRSPTQIKAAIDNYLTGLAKKQFSGAVLIEYQGNKLLSKGYGQSDTEQGIHYLPTTISDIGSVTKQFTAAAILKLEMQGKLSVDDKLSKYFDDIPQDKKNISLHQLMNMSAGLHTYSDTGGGDFEEVSEPEFLSIAMNQNLLTAPGVKWEYSNTSYSLLAVLVGRISGLSYNDYLYQNLFKPAGMEDTGYTRPGFEKDRIAVQHRDGESNGRPTEKPWNGDEPYLHLLGNGGILSTTEDLYRWHQALLGNDILSDVAKKKYFKAYIETDDESQYAYGWFVKTTPRGTKLIHHSGGNGSAFAYLYRFVDEQVSIIVVCNNHDSFNTKVIQQLEGIIFNHDFTPLNKSGYIPLAKLIGSGLTASEVIGWIKEERRKVIPTDYDISERGINRLGYLFVRQGQLDTALKVFQFNLESYPESADVFDSLGETLLELGRVEEGLAAYENALELDPDYGNKHVAQKVIEDHAKQKNKRGR